MQWTAGCATMEMEEREKSQSSFMQMKSGGGVESGTLLNWIYFLIFLVLRLNQPYNKLRGFRNAN
jgi:hypothetical protein